VLQKLRDGATSIDLNGNEERYPISYWALYAPMRNYVIRKIKAPLQKAIEGAKRLGDITEMLYSAIKRIPKITKRNTCWYNTHILIDRKEQFLKYHNNPGRQKLMEAAFNLLLFEYEHDGYYAFIYDWLIIELAMELARGNWKPRFQKFPIPHCWTGSELPDVETIRENLRKALTEQPDDRTIVYQDLGGG